MIFGSISLTLALSGAAVDIRKFFFFVDGVSGQCFRDFVAKIVF